jgi:hypothetical protein
MTDGDVILSLGIDDGQTPDAAPPPLGSCGAELYAAIAPLAQDDSLHGWPLAHLCEAIGRMRQAVADLVRDWPEEVVVDGHATTVLRPGWSRATDVSHAPGAGSEIDMLPFLGQLVGVRGIEALSDEDRRAAIRERDGFSRGSAAAILSFARRFTVDGSGVNLRERYSETLGAAVDAPGSGEVRIKRSRLLPGVDAGELRAQLTARLPAGLDFDVTITDEIDFEELRQRFADFDDLRSRFSNFDDLSRYQG